MDSTRRTILTAGVAAAASAAVPRLFAQQAGGERASSTKGVRFASTTRRPVPASLSCCFPAAD